jgi:hypothetical protein
MLATLAVNTTEGRRAGSAGISWSVVSEPLLHQRMAVVSALNHMGVQGVAGSAGEG